MPPTPASEHIGACQARRADGAPCRAGVRPGAEYCFQHDPARQTQAQAARTAGGKARSTPAPAAPIDLTTPEACIAALQETVDRVRRGDEGVNVGKLVIYAIATARAIVQSDLEERLSRLEAAMRGK